MERTNLSIPRSACHRCRFAAKAATRGGDVALLQ
jgi:hypothetical protein